MLPRLIIAVLLVNFSYIICGIAVDLGNLLGYGIGSLLQGTTPATFEAGNLGLQTKSGLAITNASIAAIAIAGAAAVILAISIPVILSALMAVAMTVIILMARQAIIIILVVISPIAFVAYLLPNTEKWFKKWLDLFVAMIILFPALALVFAASRIAAQVIANTAADDNWLLQLSAIGAAMLPFFASLPIINGSLKAAGAIGSTLGGMASARQKAIGGKVSDSSRLGEIAAHQKQQAKVRGFRRRTGDGLLARAGNRMQGSGNGFVRGIGSAASFAGTTGQRFDNRFGGRLGTQAGAARAAATIDKEEDEQINNEAILLSRGDKSDPNSLMDIAQNKVNGKNYNEVQRAAAARLVMQTGGAQHAQAMAEYMVKNADEKGVSTMQKASADALGQRKLAGFSGTDLSSFKRGTLGSKNSASKYDQAKAGWGYQDFLADRSQKGKFGANEIRTMEGDDLVRYTDLAAMGDKYMQDDQLQAFKEALRLDSDPGIDFTLTDERRRLAQAIVDRRQDGAAKNLEPLAKPRSRP